MLLSENSHQPRRGGYPRRVPNKEKEAPFRGEQPSPWANSRELPGLTQSIPVQSLSNKSSVIVVEMGEAKARVVKRKRGMDDRLPVLDFEAFVFKGTHK